MEDLMSEVQEVDKSWRRQEHDTITLLEQLRDILRKPGQDIPKALKSQLAGQGDLWKSLHSQISKCSKSLDKKFKETFVDLVQEEDSLEDGRAIDECLLQHFYREGNFEVADALAHELGISDDELKKPFEEMHRLIKALHEHDIQPAVTWAEGKRDELGSDAFRLCFQLHSLAFIDLLRLKGNLSQALAYARQNIGQFRDIFPSDVETLMGAMAFGPNLESSPYSAILYDDLWGEAEDALVAAHCSLLGLPKESALKLCLKIGTTAWPRISRVLSLMRGRPGVDCNPQEELPIDVDTSGARFHSVFVCPVMRQQSTENNPPMILLCGHVISQEALSRLSKGPNGRVKCPYCPSESTLSQAREIHF